jgi:hypothetical protein
MVFNNEIIVGDYANNKIYAFDLDVYEDDGRPQKWLRSWRALPTGQNNLNRTAHHSLQLDCETGQGITPAPIPILTSDVYPIESIDEMEVDFFFSGG